jgi:hypothetical protein
MKTFTTILLAILCATCMFEAAAKRKVTVSVTVQGTLTEADIIKEKAKLVGSLAKLLGVDKANIDLDKKKDVTTTAAPVSAAPTTAAPTTAAPNRRLGATNTTTFTFSVIVATDAEAKALTDKLKSDKFQTDLLTEMKTVFKDKTFTVAVSKSSITNDAYVPTTTAAPADKKGDVSGTTRTVVSSLLLSQVVVLLSMITLQ